MKKKKMYLMVLCLICMGTFSLFALYKKTFLQNKREPRLVRLLGTEEEYGDPGNLSFYTSTGADDAEILPEDIQNYVFIDQMGYLEENGLDTYGLNSLNEYMLRYLNYYIGEGVYQGAVLEENYNSDHNFPSFYVKIKKDGKEYIIRCIYRRADMRYEFICKEIEHEKDK